MTFEVGGYRAVEMIAAGASAQVWRGVHAATGAVVALKVLPSERLSTVRREAALATAVDHPHVVRVVDVVGDSDRCALVSEFAAGGDLAALLGARGRLSEGETLTVLLPIAAALATAHERDIVHGDLSAGNVLFDAAGRPLLADLGAGRAAAEVGMPVFATPADAAPELARGATPSPATDMFSLGSLALACLTGRHAWPADDLHDVLIQAAGGQWPDPGDDVASPALTSAVRALLEHDAERRPGAATLVMDLRAAGRPAPVELRRSVGPAQPAPPAPTGAVVIGAPPAPSRHSAPEPDHSVSGTEGPAPARGRRTDHDADRLVRSRAVTRARADAVAPPEPESRPGRLRRMFGWTQMLVGPRGSGDRNGPTPQLRPAEPSRTVRVVLITLACLLVTAAATAGGLWWAGLDRSEPATAGGSNPVAVTSPTRPSPPLLSGSPSPGPVTSAPVAGHQAPPTATATAHSSLKSPANARPTPVTTGSRTPAPNATVGTPRVPSVTWAATVEKLDEARARAVTERDVSLLDAVYTAESSARASDAGLIQGLIDRGLRVSGAGHRVSAAAMVGTSPIRVRVDDLLPSYSVLDSSGKVVGRTAARPAAARILVLVATPNGYRISDVRSV